MALADIETTLTEGVPWRTCAVCHWMSERGPDWAETLRRLLRNKGIKITDIADALEIDPTEPTIDVQALSRHARKGCSAREALR